MEFIDTVVQRNAEYSRTTFRPGLRMMPSARTMIIGCVDPRVDPFDVLGLQPGEAAAIRNVGGRIFPSTLQSMAMLRVVAQAQGAEMGEGWNLIVLHHTDCGINCLGNSNETLAKHFGVEISDLASKAIDDPRESVAHDVALLKSMPQLPGGFMVTGMVYDVTTGLIEIVVPTARLHEQ